MNTKLFVLPYKTGSASAKALSQSIGCVLLRKDNSGFKHGPEKLVINWGASEVSVEVLQTKMANNPMQTKTLVDKGAFFKTIRAYNSSVVPQDRITIPLAVHKWADAYNSYQNDGGVWFARTLLNAHSGKGIVILETEQDWANAKSLQCSLFTRYIKKNSEFRIHFRDFSNLSSALGAKVFFNQRKAAKAGIEHDFMIRNLANGFVYVNEGGDVEIPSAVALEVNRFLKFNARIESNMPYMNFGALDIIYNVHYNKAYVLEVNSAPGLSGLTLQKYTEEFKALQAQLG